MSCASRQDNALAIASGCLIPGDVVVRWEYDTDWAHAGVFDGSKVWFLTFAQLAAVDIESLARQAPLCGWEVLHNHCVAGRLRRQSEQPRGSEVWLELWLRRTTPRTSHVVSPTTAGRGE